MIGLKLKRKFEDRQNRLLKFPEISQLFAKASKYDKIKSEDREAVEFVLRFMLRIKDILTYEQICTATTEAGYTLIYSGEGVFTKVGDGKKIINLESKKEELQITLKKQS